MAEALRVREPLDDEDAAALGPADAVGGARVRLAAAVGGQPSVPGELDEDRRRRVDRHAARQGEVAFAGPQRLHGHVQCHQRRRARGVHRYRGTLEPEHVADPPRRHAGRHARQPVTLDAVRRSCRSRRRSPRRTRRWHCRADLPDRSRPAPGPPTTIPEASAAGGPSRAPRSVRCRRIRRRSPRRRRRTRPRWRRSFPVRRDRGRTGSARPSRGHRASR